jgi:hypothetical protein
MRVTQTTLDRMDSNMLKWYGHVVHVEDNRWPKCSMTWSQEGRRGQPTVKWENEVERVMKQRNLTSDDAVML